MNFPNNKELKQHQLVENKSEINADLFINTEMEGFTIEVYLYAYYYFLINFPLLNFLKFDEFKYIILPSYPENNVKDVKKNLTFFKLFCSLFSENEVSDRSFPEQFWNLPNFALGFNAKKFHKFCVKCGYDIYEIQDAKKRNQRITIFNNMNNTFFAKFPEDSRVDTYLSFIWHFEKSMQKYDSRLFVISNEDDVSYNIQMFKNTFNSLNTTKRYNMLRYIMQCHRNDYDYNYEKCICHCLQDDYKCNRLRVLYNIGISVDMLENITNSKCILKISFTYYQYINESIGTQMIKNYFSTNMTRYEILQLHNDILELDGFLQKTNNSLITDYSFWKKLTEGIVKIQSEHISYAISIYKLGMCDKYNENYVDGQIKYLADCLDICFNYRRLNEETVLYIVKKLDYYNKELFQFLLNKGMHRTFSDGSTILHLLCRKYNSTNVIDVFKYLVNEHNIDMYAKDAHQKQAHEYVCETHPNRHVLSKFRQNQRNKRNCLAKKNIIMN